MTLKHRWVSEEPHIPFDYEVIYEDSGIIVIDKPHFLATTPRGMWYRETALIRLREQFGEPDIVPAHRLDRSTAGIVVFTRKPRMRRTYQMLFQKHQTTKVYECLAPSKPVVRPQYGTIERLNPPAVFPLLRRSTIRKDRGRLQAYEEPGEPNAQTLVELGDPFEDSWMRVGMSDELTHRPTITSDGSQLSYESRESEHQERGMHFSGRVLPCRTRRYVLHPKTGKTHQLRVHMNSLGLPIIGDELYPRILNRAYDDFSQPLQLIARSLSFIDPVSKEKRLFESRMKLG